MFRAKLKKYYICVYSIIFAIINYFVESVIHYINLGSGHTFIEHLLHLELHEIWMRGFLITIILLSCCIIQIYINKLRLANFSLNTYKGIVAHDIRNIINNVSNSAELLSIMFKDKINNKKFDNFVDIIKEQSMKSNMLLTNILKLTQIKKYKKTLIKVNIHKFLHDSQKFILNSFSETNINIKLRLLERETFTQANDLLDIVFNNLLYNAVIHNKSPLINIKVVESLIVIKKRDFIKIEFKDNGVGIDDSKKGNIVSGILPTNGYSQSNRIGLGLRLVRRIVRSYGGSFKIFDRVKGDHTQGSNFVLFFKVYPI